MKEKHAKNSDEKKEDEMNSKRKMKGRRWQKVSVNEACNKCDDEGKDANKDRKCDEISFKEAGTLRMEGNCIELEKEVTKFVDDAVERRLAVITAMLERSLPKAAEHISVLSDKFAFLNHKVLENEIAINDVKGTDEKTKEMARIVECNVMNKLKDFHFRNAGEDIVGQSIGKITGMVEAGLTKAAEQISVLSHNVTFLKGRLDEQIDEKEIARKAELVLLAKLKDTHQIDEKKIAHNVELTLLAKLKDIHAKLELQQVSRFNHFQQHYNEELTSLAHHFHNLQGYLRMTLMMISVDHACEFLISLMMVGLV